MQWWKAEAIRVLKRASPKDFNQTPVYLVSRYDLDSRFSLPVEARMYTGPKLDLILQSHLESEGLWNGRGFAVVTFDHLLRNDTENILAVLHEACHRFQRGRTAAVTEQPCEDFVKINRAIFESDISPFNAHAVAALDTAKPWTGHGEDFIRTAIHLAGRININPGLLWDQNFYRLSPIEEYALRLGDEPERMAEHSLFDVAESESPAEYRRFAASDLETKESEWSEKHA